MGKIKQERKKERKREKKNKRKIEIKRKNKRLAAWCMGVRARGQRENFFFLFFASI